ncbi:hypothetical protein C4D60_Mb08t22650 [Musa balbisiana]|uniref:Aminotransferase class I/classII large domain-containing protein n=1 Tax=Musa balbisiana TaxID=52838 RepID=A0A4S8K5S5_MUSBA|nr:hypothetical protein C4D60_Mb08t22650 [Musa balbisiana]
MERKLSKASRSLTPSAIQELSHLAQRCGAINLAEGFPDFPAPPHIKRAAVAAINADLNQYRHVQGICDQLAVMMKQNHGLDGDEVLLFDPAYETYESCIILAGGIPVNVPLEPPHWTLNVDKFMKSFTSRTKAVVLNRYRCFGEKGKDGEEEGTVEEERGKKRKRWRRKKEEEQKEKRHT